MLIYALYYFNKVILGVERSFISKGRRSRLLLIPLAKETVVMHTGLKVPLDSPDYGWYTKQLPMLFPFSHHYALHSGG